MRTVAIMRPPLLMSGAAETQYTPPRMKHAASRHSANTMQVVAASGEGKLDDVRDRVTAVT